MIPLEAWWRTQADKLIIAAVVIAVAATVRGIVVLAIRKSIATMVQRTRARLEATAGRGSRLLPAGWTNARQIARTKTLGSLLSSIVTVTVVAIAALTLLSIFGVPMAPLLTSAGVGGVALAFGAQSLVKDFISGVFLIAEDQYGVGDVVELGSVSGTVEDVTLRVTRLRDDQGRIWYVRNGEVTTVGNTSQGWATAVVSFTLAGDHDDAPARTVLSEVIDRFDADPVWSSQVIDRPSLTEVDSGQAETMTLRVQARCLPNHQWGVQRELTERCRTALAAANICLTTWSHH